MTDRTRKGVLEFIRSPDRQALDRWLSGLPAGLRARVRVLGLREAFAWARRRVESWPEGG